MRRLPLSILGIRPFTIALAHAIAGLAAGLAAQDAGERPAHAAPARTAGGISRPVSIFDFRVPIHSGQPDDPQYGTFAAGRGFKCSFHDRFAFYPYLGEAYPENLPLQLRTESVTAGGKPLFAPGAEPREQHTEWRYEYHWPGGVIEAYDVREQGVEQTFTLTRRPNTAGDLVVRARATTKLTAEPVEGRHTSLTFRGPRGEAIVSYGAATAVDALGRRRALATTFDGTHIELRVEGSWLESAVFPVTIDPLIANTPVASSSRLMGHADVARDGHNRHLYIAFHLIASGSDHDVYVVRANDNCQPALTLYSDVSTTYDSRHPQIAPQHLALIMVLVYERRYRSSLRTVCRMNVVHLPFGTSTSIRQQLDPPDPRWDEWRPDIGGTATPSAGATHNLLIVWQQERQPSSRTDFRNTPNSLVWVATYDSKNGKLGTRRTLIWRAQGDHEWPCVNQLAEHGGLNDRWVVGLMAHTNGPVDDWDVPFYQIEAVSGRSIGQATALRGGVSLSNKMRPSIAGRQHSGGNGRYLASVVEHPRGSTKEVNFRGSSVWVHRIDWDSGGNPSIRCSQMIKNSGGRRTYWNGRTMGYDDRTQSHWLLAYDTGGTAWLRRIGFDCGVAESVTPYTWQANDFDVAATFDPRADQFPVAWASRAAVTGSHRIWCARCSYGANASSNGTSCSGGGVASIRNGLLFSTGSPPARPDKGSQFFQLRLEGAGNRTGVAVLGLGLSPGSIPLPGGCSFDNFPIITLGAVLNQKEAKIGSPLPSGLANFVLYADWVHVSPALTNIRSPAGLRLEIK